MGEWIESPVRVFQGRQLPEPATPAGYAAVWNRYDLPVPLPPRLAAISLRHRRTETAGWLLLTPRHRPDDTLAGQLEFALKWEGVDLAILKKLFLAVPPEDISAVVRAKPTGVYTRRLWFLYEWLMKTELNVPAPGKVRSVPAVDPKHQYVVGEGPLSSRHKVLNNLPGPPEFCPLVRRTEALERLADLALDERARAVIGRTHPDVVARTAAFLLLSDSKSSFRIEGEQPTYARAARWGQTIAQAGLIELDVAEFERLQRVVIGDDRFVHLGLRENGGFVGQHDRTSGEPLPEHVSARPDDLRSLLEGLTEYARTAVRAGLDPVIAAATVAFGFVYIHPFEDGNGRLHRWLIHHVLATAGFSPPGIVFPVSAAILRHIAEYRCVLESYSRPLLSCIEWRPTEQGNVDVLNETADFYRYFDATDHATFLYNRVQETVERDLPDGVAYLEAFDRFRAGVQQIVDMPDRTIDLLHRFLRQNEGLLSERARTHEFADLTDEEASRFEQLFTESFAER